MAYTAQQQQLFQPFQNVNGKGLQPLKPQSGFNQFLFGRPESFQRTPTQTPQGMEFLESLLSGAKTGLENPQAGFEPIANEATRQFNTQTIPGIAERFTAANGQRSSAFQGALGAAGSDLQSRLAALSSQYGLQNRQGLLQQGQLGLTPQFETQHYEGTNGALHSLLAELIPGLQNAAKNYGQFSGNSSNSNTSSGIELLKKILPLLVGA